MTIVFIVTALNLASFAYCEFTRRRYRKGIDMVEGLCKALTSLNEAMQELTARAIAYQDVIHEIAQDGGWCGDLARKALKEAGIETRN